MDDQAGFGLRGTWHHDAHVPHEGKWRALTSPPSDFSDLRASQDDSAKIVTYSKYPPLGTRGYGPMFAPHAFPGVEPGSQYDDGAKDILVIVQIESPSGVQNANEIAAVEGVDVLFVGPFDLSKQMGVARGSPEHEAAIQQVLDAAHRANKKAAIFCKIPMCTTNEALSQHY